MYSVPRSAVVELSWSYSTNESLYTVLLLSANRDGYKPLIMRALGEKLPNRVTLTVQFTYLDCIFMFVAQII